MKETRHLFSGDLRQLCIKRNWYTRGTNAEYDALLDAANKEGILTEDIVKLAEDIKSHSDTGYPVTSICFEIAEICHSFFAEDWE